MARRCPGNADGGHCGDRTRHRLEDIVSSGDPEAFESLLVEMGAPDDFATLLAGLFATIFDGRNASVTGGVEKALGRKARDFSDYVRGAAASGVWSAPVSA